MQLNRLNLAQIVLIAACCLPAEAITSTQATMPAIGQPAPALSFTNLLQAPAGAKTDWSSLHGKVVVLEFWATWCGGCIIEIPHLNDLVQSLDPKKVLFIAVDDEDPAVVKKFLAKTPISGWLGFDTSAKIIDAYGAKVRPRTIVVDPQGRIAAVLSPYQLAKEQLLALADGKQVTFPTDTTTGVRERAFKEARAAADAIAAGTDGPKPLFDLSIRSGDPAGKTAMVHLPGKNGEPETEDILNAPLSMLLEDAAGIAASRLTIHGDKGEKYSLHVAAPGGGFDQLAPAIQLAIVATTGRKLAHVTTMENAYILRATPKATSLPASTADQHMSFCFYNPRIGKIQMMNATLDSLASALEDALAAPVVNETGIAGQFSTTFDLPKDDVEAAKTMLEKNMGLTLVLEKRNIERIVLDAPTANEEAARANKPTDAPAKPSPKP